jgi:hypothetical protein
MKKVVFTAACAMALMITRAQGLIFPIWQQFIHLRQLFCNVTGPGVALPVSST